MTMVASNGSNIQNGGHQHGADLLLLMLGLYKHVRAPPGAWDYLTIRDLVNLSFVSKNIRNDLLLGRKEGDEAIGNDGAADVGCGVEYTKCRDGKDYLVPFPGFPGLFLPSLKKSSSLSSSSLSSHFGLFPHQLASLHAMYRLETASKRFGALRGGILGDAPGLGKTITMLAMIVSTAGCRPINPPEFWNNNQEQSDAINEGWECLRTNPASQQEILITLKPIRLWIIRSFGATSKEYRQFQSLAAYVSPPYNDKKSKRNNEGKKFPTIRDFELYVMRNLRKTLCVPLSEIELFRRNVLLLKEGLNKENRKLFKSINEVGNRIRMERSLITTSATLIIVPDALLEHWFQQIHCHLNLEVFADENENKTGLHKVNESENNNNDHHHLFDDLLCSTTTKTMPELYSSRGVVYLDGIGDIADIVDARKPLRNISLKQEPLPQPWQLSKYLIVVTVFSRIQAEFLKEVQVGNMQKIQTTAATHSVDEGRSNIGGSRRRNSAGIRASSSRNKRRRRQYSDDEDEIEQSSSSGRNGGASCLLSPLLQLRWLRIVVDEGHNMGQKRENKRKTGGSNASSSSNFTGMTYFINHLAAERRWVLSGTPTTGDEDEVDYTPKALDQLQRLLFFLRHPVYGTDNNFLTTQISDDNGSSTLSTNRQKHRKKSMGVARSNWETHVKFPFANKENQGRQELVRVLKDMMVMHRKEDVQLPQPIFQQAECDVWIPDNIQETLVQRHEHSKIGDSGIVSGLEKYTHSAAFQSLVDEAQAKHIVKTIREAQRALRDRKGDNCANENQLNANNLNGIIPVAAFNNFKNQELIADRKYNNNYKNHDHRQVKAVAYSYEKNNLLSVTEHLIRKLGNDNIAEMYETTLGDMSAELSRFRHGFRECKTCPVCKRKIDVVVSNKRLLCTNDLLEVVTLTWPRKRFLIEPERIKRPRNVPLVRLEGEPMSSYYKYRKFWRVGDVLEIDAKDYENNPLLPARETKETWESYGSGKCEESAALDFFQGQDWYFGPLPNNTTNGNHHQSNNYYNGSGDNNVETELVEDVNNNGNNSTVEDSGGRSRVSIEVELVKWQKCSKFHSHARWYSGPRLSDSPVERIKENVCLLSLDAALSHGLDLSFVTHIFLLDPIDDAALLEQVTSRAHRLGATGPVIVNTVNTFYKLSESTKCIVDKAIDEIIDKKRKKGQHRQLQQDVNTSNSNTREEKNREKDRSEELLYYQHSSNQKNVLSKVVCQYCYRQFDCRNKAEKHEITNCPRNPKIENNTPYRLSSIYREIRPPPAISASNKE